MKNLKRYILVVACIAVAGVLFLMTRRAHIPPPNPEDLWVSDNPDIWFVGFDEERGGPAGQMTVNGEVSEVVMIVGPGPRFNICLYPLNASNDILVRGSCYFSEDKGTVHVIEAKAGILSGTKTITFHREDNKETAQNLLDH